MNKVLDLLDLVPGWVYALIVTALVAFGGIQEVRIAALEVDVVTAKGETLKEKTDAAEARTARMHAALTYETKISKLESQHAAEQQEKEDAWNREKAAQDSRRRADAATVAGLRDKLAAYTARGGATGRADPAPGVGAEDRLATISGLLEESLGLLAEGRSVVERRDGEVKRLIEQLQLDRATCGWQKLEVTVESAR